MNTTRRLALALPALAIGAAVFALPAATAQAAAPTGIVLEKPKPKTDKNTGKCTETGFAETTAIAGGRKVTTLITCNKGQTPAVTTTVERRTPPNNPPPPIPPKGPADGLSAK